VYRSGATAMAGVFQPTWFDGQGKVTGAFAQPGPEGGLVLSPDGTHAAGRDPGPQAKGDIWRWIRCAESARGSPSAKVRDRIPSGRRMALASFIRPAAAWMPFKKKPQAARATKKN